METQQNKKQFEKPLDVSDALVTLNHAEAYAHRRVCEIVSSIYFYGGFKSETHNERQLAELLSKLGYIYKNEDELMAKLYPNLTPSTPRDNV